MGFSAHATDYYVSPTGSDTNSGKSASTPFATVAKINTLKLKPGDRVLLEGGQSFAGPLKIDSVSSGAKDRPIVVDSYGRGRAEIKNLAGHGVVVRDADYITLQNLNVTGADCSELGHTPRSCEEVEQCTRSIGSGIVLLSEGLQGALQGFNLNHLSVIGFSSREDPKRPGQVPEDLNGMGIVVMTRHRGAGFRDIQFSDINVFGNGIAGLQMEVDNDEWPSKVYEDVSIVRVSAKWNTGIPKLSRPPITGSGIVISGVTRGRIEDSEGSENGCLNDASGGPMGVWAYNSDQILFRNNRAVGNMSRSHNDGGGFDFDGGTTNSVMEYNYAAENAGPGYSVDQFPDAPLMANNVLRHNVSMRDGQAGGSCGISIWGKVNGTLIENNRVYVSDGPKPPPAGLMLFQWTGDSLVLRNNSIVAQNTDLLYFGETPGLESTLDIDESNQFALCGDKGSPLNLQDESIRSTSATSLEKFPTFHLSAPLFESARTTSDDCDKSRSLWEQRRAPRPTIAAIQPFSAREPAAQTPQRGRHRDPRRVRPAYSSER